MYYVSWNDWNGGQYCRSFKTKEEKEKLEALVRESSNIIAPVEQVTDADVIKQD